MMIPVVFCFNDNFIIPAGVSIYSLLKNAYKSTFYDIYILYKKDYLTVNNIDKIKALENVFNNCSITFINILDAFISNNYNHLSQETYFRLAIPELIKEYEKVIYCDSDTIILKDLTSLLEDADTNFSISGVLDSVLKHNRNFKILLEKRNFDTNKYINAGILVFNNKLINSNNKHQLIHDLIKTNTFKYMDQDIINTVWKNDIFLLPSNFNYTYLNLLNNDGVDPFIIHYINEKPWDSPCAFNDVWWSYFKSSPFNDMDYYYMKTKEMYKDLDKHLLIGNYFKKLGFYRLTIFLKRIIYQIFS